VALRTQPDLTEAILLGHTPFYWRRVLALHQAVIVGSLIVPADLRACAMPIGQRLIEVSPDQTNGAPSTFLLGRVPASGAANLRAALACNAINDIEYRFFVRGVNDPEEPDTWTALGAGYTALPESTPMAICQSDLSVSGVTPANYHQLEFSLRLRLTGAGSAPAGFVRVSAGLSYS
jgi:hypothetical protein